MGDCVILVKVCLSVREIYFSIKGKAYLLQCWQVLLLLVFFPQSDTRSHKIPWSLKSLIRGTLLSCPRFLALPIIFLMWLRAESNNSLKFVRISHPGPATRWNVWYAPFRCTNTNRGGTCFLKKNKIAQSLGKCRLNNGKQTCVCVLKRV